MNQNVCARAPGCLYLCARPLPLPFPPPSAWSDKSCGLKNKPQLFDLVTTTFRVYAWGEVLVLTAPLPREVLVLTAPLPPKNGAPQHHSPPKTVLHSTTCHFGCVSHFTRIQPSYLIGNVLRAILTNTRRHPRVFVRMARRTFPIRWVFEGC